jgi:NET1-associated nuclear protein 1 (U3 small nucleolar RNA-associated protein 17)
MSTDGKWLATVDSWSPHETDVDALQPFPLRDTRDAHSHGEIFLKFWMWNDTTALWELATRIDSPHFQIIQDPVQVYCLVSRPSRHEFATFGGDGILRVWQPTTRYPGSAKGRSRAGPLEQTWR